jgi:hypothetical protein
MYDRALPSLDNAKTLLEETAEFVLQFSHLNLLTNTKFQHFLEFVEVNL